MCFALMSTCPLDHTCFPTQERGNEKSVPCFGRGGERVRVEDAHALTQSGELLWALSQPGDCGKSAWAPGPSLPGAPVSGLFGQACCLHGTTSLCPGLSCPEDAGIVFYSTREPGTGGWTLHSQLWLPYYFLPCWLLVPHSLTLQGCQGHVFLCFLRPLQPGSATA